MQRCSMLDVHFDDDDDDDHTMQKPVKHNDFVGRNTRAWRI